MVSQLQFQKGKDAELTWVDGQIGVRESGQDAKPMNAQNEPMDGIQYFYIYLITIFNYLNFLLQSMMKTIKYLLWNR